MASIFLSSTFDDLKEERRALLDVVVPRIRVVAIAQESFGASSTPPVGKIKSEITNKDCVLYLLILGFRYGSLVPASDFPAELDYPPDKQVSYSEMEFDLAGRQKIPRLVYVKQISRSRRMAVAEDEEVQRLRFINKIDSERCTFCRFSNTLELAVQATIDISKQLHESEWVLNAQGREFQT